MNLGIYAWGPYRVRRTIDYNAFGKANVSESLEPDVFAMPPRKEKGQEFSIIQRPPVPELENFVEDFIEKTEIKVRVRGRR